MNSGKLTKLAANTAICSVVSIGLYSISRLSDINLEFLIGWLTCMLYIDLKNKLFRY